MDDNEEEEEDNGDEIDEEYDPDAKKKIETPQSKIKKEKKKLVAQAANGEIQSTSTYFFYHLFKFLALACLLAAFGCLFYLIYELYQMFKYRNDYTQLENMSGPPGSSAVNLDNRNQFNGGRAMSRVESGAFHRPTSSANGRSISQGRYNNF